MTGYIIAFDIGGTTIKAGIVDSDLSLLEGTLETYPSQSDRDAETIVDHIYSIILKQWKKVKKEHGCITGIGFGFPGPFDYVHGISFIKGLGKYEAIYGLDIASAIRDRLSSASIAMTDDFSIAFENDAAVFTLGEYKHLEAVGCDRLIGITLGTGCGSSFIHQGKIVRGAMGVPDSGEIFNQPFRESIIDDYISRRGILQLAAAKGIDTAKNDVAEIAALAETGVTNACDVFDAFGTQMGEALRRYVSEFSPDMMVFGGQISKSFDLFQESFIKSLAPYHPKIKISEDLSKSALIGVARMVLNMI